MKHLSQSLLVSGYVREIDPPRNSFTLESFGGDTFEISVTDQTYFFQVRNSDKIDRDRTNQAKTPPISRFLEKDMMVSAYGVYQIAGQNSSYTANRVAVYGDNAGHYNFESGSWWLNQITAFADTWLQRQFGLNQNFDFTGYRTNLSSGGGKIEGADIQECDTIARLLYGLCSAYNLTGNQRYLNAAREGVEYQRRMFRTVSHDGSFVIWHHAIDNGKKILESLFSDDAGTIPLYEQIYAIAGLTQYYKITQDWETLDDILRSVRFFIAFYKDKSPRKGFYSHLDPVTLTPDSNRLGDNRSKKNWNSVGDHTPAYLLNLLLSLEGVADFKDRYQELLDMQREVADLILQHFPDPDPSVPYVRERFHDDWSYDSTYKWQQDRAVVGHNLKIAWNLTRVYHLLGDKEYLDLAIDIANKMPDAGMDIIRGGWFDVVERRPKNGMPIQFTWHNRKAWWQQEQAILAYLILAGTVTNQTLKDRYHRLARESIAFWNLTFLDQDYGETYFDVIDNGTPYLVEDRARSASHSKSGYHSMELNFLAHIYYTLLVTRQKSVCLYYNLSADRTVNTLNTLPDCLPRDQIQIERVEVNGEEYHNFDKKGHTIILNHEHMDKEIAVTVWLRHKDATTASLSVFGSLNEPVIFWKGGGK